MVNEQDPNNPYPPETPYGEEYNFPGEGQQMESSKPAVAAAPGKVLLVLALIVAIVGTLLYSIFSDGKEEKKPEVKPAEVPTAPISIPSLPEPISTPIAPVDIAPPPSLVVPPTLSPGLENEPVIEEENISENRKQRLRSSMLIVSNKSKLGGVFDSSGADKAMADNDPNLAFSKTAIDASKAKKELATTLGNLQNTVAQGKIISAVLETAINTDLPGNLRAIISRDIYAEAGRAILVPKGSRLIGTYNTNVFRGQRRVFIVWTRLIRPDGIDVAIGSPGVDALGRGGVAGEVHNKYMEAYAGAFLTSAISIGVAVASEKAINDNKVTTTTNTDGSTTQNGSAGALATADAVDNIGGVSRKIVNDLLDLRPTITVDQGTPINVFVNKDLIFPSDVLNKIRFVE